MCMISTRQSLKDAYSKIWHDSKTSIESNKAGKDAAPEEGGSRWGVSLIFRPDRKTSQALANACEAMRQYVGSESIVYTPANFHTTVMSIGYFRADYSNDETFPLILSAVNESLKNVSEFSHEICGLTASTTAVLAQGFPAGDTLSRIRELLTNEMLKTGLNWPEKTKARTFSHVSLAVFGGPLTDGRGLFQYIEKNRSRDYGVSTIPQLEMVTYQKNFNTVNMITREIIELQ